MKPRDQEVPKEIDDVVEPDERPDDEVVPRPIDPDEEDPLGRPVQLQP